MASSTPTTTTSSSAAQVRVGVRVRPETADDDQDVGRASSLELTDRSIKLSDRSFTYDAVFDAFTSQLNLYNHVDSSSVVEQVQQLQAYVTVLQAELIRHKFDGDATSAAAPTGQVDEARMKQNNVIDYLGQLWKLAQRREVTLQVPAKASPPRHVDANRFNLEKFDPAQLFLNEIHPEEEVAIHDNYDREQEMDGDTLKPVECGLDLKQVVVNATPGTIATRSSPQHPPISPPRDPEAMTPSRKAKDQRRSTTPSILRTVSIDNVSPGGMNATPGTIATRSSPQHTPFSPNRDPEAMTPSRKAKDQRRSTSPRFGGGVVSSAAAPVPTTGQFDEELMKQNDVIDYLNSLLKLAQQPSSTRVVVDLFESTERLGGQAWTVECAPTTTTTAILERSYLTTTTTNKNTIGTTPPDLLGAIEYADNVVYVHSDAAFMPPNRNAWASWNCLGQSAALPPPTSHQPPQQQKQKASGGPALDSDEDVVESLGGANGRFKAVSVTYWLNQLQNLQTDTNIFVSLNPHAPPDPALTYKRVIMAHPQLTPSTLTARQELLHRHQGVDGLWFCGAWTGYGFHEDGFRSGLEVATALSGVPLPWATAATAADGTNGVLAPPDLTTTTQSSSNKVFRRLYQTLFHDVPVAICQRFIYYFLNQAVQKGKLRLKFNDGSTKSFGDGTPCGCDSSAVTLRIFDPWFFVKTAFEYDLGLARSYMAGLFVVEPLEEPSLYHPALRPADVTRDETTVTMGDPIGLTRLFLLLIGNRDRPPSRHVPKKAGRGHFHAGALTNASRLVLGKIRGLFNYLRYKNTMDNSERGGSLKNIHAHYNLSNDLFATFLDKETLMYSSAIYDAVPAPTPQSGLSFRGTLEEAQWRKLDTLLARAQVQPGHTLLDMGFGWGGLSIYAAEKYGCRVTGISLSVEQKALADKRVQEKGLGSLISFEVVDYRTFARRKENQGKFDRVLSCEMIEALGHKHLGGFFWVVEQVLAHDGILVMEAITTPEQRYETYIRSTDFINTIIFPGSCCPSLHALVDAAYQQSSLTLKHIENIGLHYAQTLAEWRRRFNASEATVRSLGFDDVFLRAWNYYLTYCEAGFFSQTENCLILVFARPGCKSLIPLCQTRSVTQVAPRTLTEFSNWLTDGIV